MKPRERLSKSLSKFWAGEEQCPGLVIAKFTNEAFKKRREHTLTFFHQSQIAEAATFILLTATAQMSEVSWQVHSALQTSTRQSTKNLSNDRWLHKRLDRRFTILSHREIGKKA